MDPSVSPHLDRNPQQSFIVSNQPFQRQTVPKSSNGSCERSLVIPRLSIYSPFIPSTDTTLRIYARIPGYMRVRASVLGLSEAHLSRIAPGHQVDAPGTDHCGAATRSDSVCILRRLQGIPARSIAQRRGITQDNPRVYDPDSKREGQRTPVSIAIQCIDNSQVFKDLFARWILVNAVPTFARARSAPSVFNFNLSLRPSPSRLGHLLAFCLARASTSKSFRGFDLSTLRNNLQHHVSPGSLPRRYLPGLYRQARLMCSSAAVTVAELGHTRGALTRRLSCGLADVVTPATAIATTNLRAHWLRASRTLFSAIIY